ncbi:hypothetical protein [Marinovum algicola]|uniref:hypothetical protein n=1 Tax=Marinovum algicola TaxID=42444 RepID=UPI003B5170FB
MIGAISGKGVNRAKAICDDCGREEVVTCSYEKSDSARFPEGKPNEGQIKAKITQHGWSFVKRCLRCPTCEAKRKADRMNAKTPKEVTGPDEPNGPTRKQKREIIDMLEAVYDVDAERYKAGDTDDTVADVLGVRPGWVTELREDLFGPDGANEEIENLRCRIGVLREILDAYANEFSGMFQTVRRLEDDYKKALKEASDLQCDLEKIKKAVGPRNLQKAGVS